MKKRILIEDDWNSTQSRIDDCNFNISLKANLDHSHHWDQINSKPSFHDLSFSGHWNDIDGIPSLHSVAISGSYNDLEDIPEEIDLTIIDGRISDLEDWAQRKVSSIPSITATPSATTINILGIEVATGSAITALVSAHIGLRNSHNNLLLACKTWGWMES